MTDHYKDLDNSNSALSNQRCIFCGNHQMDAAGIEEELIEQGANDDVKVLDELIDKIKDSICTDFLADLQSLRVCIVELDKVIAANSKWFMREDVAGNEASNNYDKAWMKIVNNWLTLEHCGEFPRI